MNYELWLKRRGEPNFNYIKNISKESQFYELDNVDSSEFSEAIIVQRIDGNLSFINYRKYKNKILCKK